MKTRSKKRAVTLILSAFAIVLVLLMVPTLLVPAEHKSPLTTESETVNEETTDILEEPEVEEEDRESSAIELVEKDEVMLNNALAYGEPGLGCDFTEKVVSYGTGVVFIYKMADDTSEKLGAMLTKNEAKIIAITPGWTKVSFKGMVGYVKNREVLFGLEALSVASENGKEEILLTQKEVNVYSTCAEDELLFVLSDAKGVEIISESDGYFEIQHNNGRGYVKNNDIKSTYVLDEAMSMEEYENYLEELRKAEELRKKKEEEERKRKEREAAIQAGLNKYIPTTQGESFNLSTEELWLLACIIKYESGWEPYEGKLAVANVVLNRYKTIGSMSGVIYAKNQFSGVADGNGNPSAYFKNNYLDKPLEYRLTSAHAEECMKAAIEAASGVNNIGNYKFFIGIKIAQFDKYTNYKIIGNHCFYDKWVK